MAEKKDQEPETVYGNECNALPSDAPTQGRRTSGSPSLAAGASSAREHECSGSNSEPKGSSASTPGSARHAYATPEQAIAAARRALQTHGEALRKLARYDLESPMEPGGLETQDQEENDCPPTRSSSNQRLPLSTEGVGL